MTTYTQQPTYYRVTWTLNSPNDYSGLTGNQSGGLDSTSARNYNRLIHTTGTTSVTTNVMSDGDTIVINGYSIRFDSTMPLSNVITEINLNSKFTNVIADQRYKANYITLANAPGTEGSPFYLAEGIRTGLANLGLTASSYSSFPNEVGATPSGLASGNIITINNVNVVMTAGTVSSAVTAINGQTINTGVVALPAATYLQLASTNGQPWAINGGNAVTALGFTTGTHGGYPTALSNSQGKDRSNMRWTQAISELESFSTPISISNVVRTGNLNGNGSCTTFQFTIGYADPDQVVTVARTTEPDSGNTLVGTQAIKRAVARSMTSSIVGNRNIFDPTIEAIGAYANRPNPAQIQSITAAGLDTVLNIATIEQNISVTQISGI